MIFCLTIRFSFIFYILFHFCYRHFAPRDEILQDKVVFEMLYSEQQTHASCMPSNTGNARAYLQICHMFSLKGDLKTNWRSSPDFKRFHDLPLSFLEQNMQNKWKTKILRWTRLVAPLKGFSQCSYKPRDIFVFLDTWPTLYSYSKLLPEVGKCCGT